MFFLLVQITASEIKSNLFGDQAKQFGTFLCLSCNQVLYKSSFFENQFIGKLIKDIKTVAILTTPSCFFLAIFDLMFIVGVWQQQETEVNDLLR